MQVEWKHGQDWSPGAEPRMVLSSKWRTMSSAWRPAGMHHGVLSVQANREEVQEISSPPKWPEDYFKLKTSEQRAAMKENFLNKQPLPKIQLLLSPLSDSFLFERRLILSTGK